MASTITDSTLTVTVKEEITINGIENNSENKYINTGINEIFKRIVTCPASQETIVLRLGTNVYGAAGDLAVGDCKYLRLTNKDDANSCKVAYITTNTNCTINLGPLESHMFGATSTLGIGQATDSPTYPTLENLVQVKVDPAANAIDVEVFAASA